MLNLRSLLLGMALAVAAPGVWADTLNMPAPAPAQSPPPPTAQPPAKAQPKGPAHQPTESQGKTRPAAPNVEFSVKMPRRGMTMKQVEKEFGPPLKKLPQVGDPPHQPITRWIYKDYTVYFEYQYVIQSVLNTIPVKP